MPLCSACTVLRPITVGGATNSTRESRAARVLISHDVEQGLAEADLVLGLEGGRPALLAPVAEVGADDVRGLYR